MIYTGIGSRETPNDVLTFMYGFGAYCGDRKFILRSGGAEGADTAFEQGCLSVKGPMEIYLPWRGFNKRYGESYYEEATQDAYTLAEQIYPDYFSSIKPTIKKLLVRNIHQVLGYDLKSPSDLVVCYCKQDPTGKYIGGTSYAIMVADKYKIPVVNLASRRTWKMMKGNSTISNIRDILQLASCLSQD